MDALIQIFDMAGLFGASVLLFGGVAFWLARGYAANSSAISAAAAAAAEQQRAVTQKFQQLEVDRQALTAQVKALADERDALEEKLEAAIGEAQGLRKLGETAEADMSQLRRQLDGLKADHDKLKREIDALTRQKLDAESLLERERQTNAAQQKQIEELRGKISLLEIEQARLRGENDALHRLLRAWRPVPADPPPLAESIGDGAPIGAEGKRDEAVVIRGDAGA